MNLGVLNSVLSAASGVRDLIGKKKKSPTQTAAEQDLANKQKFSDEAWRLYQSYDPLAEANQAATFTQNATSKAVYDALTKMKMSFGGRTDDTRSLPIAQQSLDSAVNPVAQMLLEYRLGAANRKMNALQQAMSVSQPGSLAESATQIEQRPGGGTPIASIQQLANGIGGLMPQPNQNAPAPNAAPVNMPSIPKTTLKLSKPGMPNYVNKIPKLKR